MPVETERRGLAVFEPTRTTADQLTSIVTSSTLAPAGLDWDGFSAVYFPERRRHDLEALVAYGAYRRSHSGTALSADERTRIGPGRDANGARALRNWENEGGATLSPHGR
jgi:hypothetical protein